MTERRKGMDEFVQKFENLLVMVAEFRAESKTDRDNMRIDIMEIKSSLKRMNGDIHENKEKTLTLATSCVTHLEKTESLLRWKSRMNYVIAVALAIGLIGGYVLEHFLRM